MSIAVEKNPTLLRFVEAAEQADHRALTGSGGAHQRHVFAGMRFGRRGW